MDNVVFMGHSFIRRMDTALIGPWVNLGFNTNDLAVHCLSRSGGRIADMYNFEFSQRLTSLCPKLVLLQIGGNDLDQLSCNVEDLANELFTLIQWLNRRFGVAQIVVMQVLYRTSTRSVDVESFNSSVYSFNRVIKERCSEYLYCYYWRHKGLSDGIFRSLCQDGVHLSKGGLRRYLCSVRAAAGLGWRLARPRG